MQVSQADSFETLQALRIGWRQEKKGTFQFFVECFFYTSRTVFVCVLLMMLSVA
jgi:hypothetical protein